MRRVKGVVVRREGHVVRANVVSGMVVLPTSPANPLPPREPFSSPPPPIENPHHLRSLHLHSMINLQFHHHHFCHRKYLLLLPITWPAIKPTTTIIWDFSPSTSITWLFAISQHLTSTTGKFSSTTVIKKIEFFCQRRSNEEAKKSRQIKGMLCA